MEGQSQGRRASATIMEGLLPSVNEGELLQTPEQEVVMPDHTCCADESTLVQVYAIVACLPAVCSLG